MDIERFVRAMPKVELNLRLEGVFRRETMLNLADQNDIRDQVKRFDDWVDLMDDPDYDQLDKIIQNVSQWLRYPDDLSRIAYDAGVYLYKQNVKYAEVLVNPVLHMQPNMTFETFINALNDGRERAERGWGVRMAWVLVVPRNEPRRADEISRWASSATGKKGGVVGFGVVGKEDLQPSGQFERSFNTAKKKEVPTLIQAGNVHQADGILDVFEHLHPNRILDGWGMADAPDVIEKFIENDVTLGVSMARALCLGWTHSYPTYPLRELKRAGVKLFVSADMPSYFHSGLSDEYLAVVEHNGVSVEELEELAISTIEHSFLPIDEKLTMAAMFMSEYERLKSELAEAEDVTPTSEA